jgi:hypothetical protein
LDAQLEEKERSQRRRGEIEKEKGRRGEREARKK